MGPWVSILSVFIASLLLGGCGNPVTWNDPDGGGRDSLVNYHRTRHFVFFYDISVYSKGEIIANGKTKEAHLDRINAELGVTFDKEIMVRLISESGSTWSGQAFPREPYFIQETRDYFVEDNGHEIAHIISFEALGFPESHFFLEGLAAAHELDSEPKLSRLCGSDLDSSELFAILKTQFPEPVSSKVDYALAAAYVEWLEVKFGMERFRAFYRDMGDFPGSSISSLCYRNFGMYEDELHGEFISKRYKPAMRSKTCDS